MSRLSDTQREYAKRILKVMVYIEKHLDEPMDLDHLAKVACFSAYHFHRIFRAYAGETLHSYVQRLRLQRAAAQLAAEDKDVTDVALDAGYETPSAFSRAFKKHWGKSPSGFRGEMREKEMYRRIELKNKEIVMQVELVELEDKEVLFVRRMGCYFQSAPLAYTALVNFLQSKGIDPMTAKTYGVGHDDPEITEEAKVRYDACVLRTEGLEPEGEVGAQVIPGGPHARFTHVGDLNNLGDTYDYIYSKWYPESGKTLAERPCVIEFLQEEQQGKPMEEWICYVYLPLK